MTKAAQDHYRPVVLIVGGGYAGLTLARKLDDTNRFRVVLLERKRYFLHNMAALRCVVDPLWFSSIVLPYKV